MSRASLHWFGVSNAIAHLCIFTERNRSSDWARRMGRSVPPISGVYPTVVGDVHGRTVAVVQGVAPSYLRDALYYAREHLSCRRALFVGTGGTLSGFVGDFILAGSAALVDEQGDIVRQGAAAGWNGDRLHSVAAAFAAQRGIVESTVAVGTVATVPGMSWETGDRLAKLRDIGIDLVTMDTAHFFAACQSAGLDGLALQWATDAPLSGAFVWTHDDDARQRELDKARQVTWQALPDVALFAAQTIGGGYAIDA